jgi:hypothetical protein
MVKVWFLVQLSDCFQVPERPLLQTYDLFTDDQRRTDCSSVPKSRVWLTKLAGIRVAIRGHLSKNYE